MMGLFHAKMAATRMVANEHWGTANSKAPWSLWRMNSLPGRKAISVRWKAKKLTPFRLVLELILKLTLPANIIDGFRIYCQGPTLKRWVSEVQDAASLRSIACKVRDKLCSATRARTGGNGTLTDSRAQE